ncbi:STAS domain-containing protein [Streptomyces apricus]|uniref:Anti-sigma factor antagonist n=1 Tax=Streptomyces apricus TaxID=1828112 RepID=A0A5B0BNC8_9ACTN|nr:STAS domain-containing protein [Streptomyces apricus]KAA0943207.1 STAS domain-containing protein [Streptomyces apricus]
MPDASIKTTASGRYLVAKVSGEMDHATGPVLRPQFEELLCQDKDSVVLDLSDVSFCDSVGLNTLISIWREAEENGTELVLACTPGPVQRILQITGVDQLLPHYGTVTDATTALGH